MFSSKGTFRALFYWIIMCFNFVYCDLESPCPDIFNYRMVNNDIKGDITVPSPNTNILQLDIRLTVGNKVEGYNGNIVLFTSKNQAARDFQENKPIRYIVNFPFWFTTPPQITRIEVNGNLICYGPGLSLDKVPVLTTIDLEHILTITRTSGGENNNPYANPGPSAGGGNPQDAGGRLQGNVFLKDVYDNNQNTNYNHQSPYYKPRNFQYPYDRNPYYNNREFYNNPYYTPYAAPSLDTIPQTPPSPTAGTYYPPNIPTARTKPPFTFPPVQFTTPTPPATIPTSARPSIGNRQDFGQHLGFPLPDDACGVTEKNVVQLLAHAEPVLDVRYPWLVAIFTKSERSLNFACGGSLISYKHVISAAHCFVDDDPDVYQFVMSDNMRQLFSFENKTVREALKVYRHPQYLPKSADADIAIAVLRTRVPTGQHIRPVCLWSEDIDIRLVVGKFGKVVGWGQDENNQLAKKEPKEVNMPILDAAECVQSNNLFSDFVSERSFCAGYKNGTGPCFGDSGSGFFMNRNGKYTLRGIVSITILDNISECKISDYSALTDVTKFNDWIKGILNT